MKQSQFIRTIAAAALLLMGGIGAQAANTTLSSSNSQALKGWGVYPSTWSSQYGPAMVNYPNAASVLGQMGETWYRISIDGNSGNSNGTLNTTWMSGLKSQISTCTSVGPTQYVLNTWSPPPYMKLPEQTTRGTSSTGATEYLNSAYESAFVSYWIAVLNDLKNNTSSGSAVGLPAFISIQNEANFNAPSWEGCDYDINAAQQALYRQVVKDLRTSLNNNGYGSIGILGAEPADPSGDLSIFGSGFSQLGSDSALNSALAGIAYHTYDQQGLNQINSSSATYGKDKWQLEWCPTVSPESNGGEWDLAVTIFRHLGADLITGGTNYWFWWDGFSNAASNSASNQSLFWNNADSGYHYSTWYYIFKTLWTNVRPGWYVQSFSSCDDSTFTISNAATLAVSPNATPLAVDLYSFRNSTNTQNVVVLVNPSSSAGKSVTINGLSGSSGILYVSTSSQNQVGSSVTVSGGAATMSLPAYSVSIFVTGVGSGVGSGTALDRSRWSLYSASSDAADGAKAWDGSLSTRWTTQTVQVPNQYFQINLGSSQSISKIVLDAGSSTEYPRAYTAYTSTDGYNWTSVAVGVGSGQITTVTFSAITARYVMIKQTGSNGSYWWSIGELNIYH